MASADDTLNDLIDRTDCRELAAALKLKDPASEQCWCPACQSRDQTDEPALDVQPEDAQCRRCGFEGDAIELVIEAKGIAPDLAKEWLADFLDGPEAGTASDAPRKPGAPSSGSDSSVDMLAQLAGVLDPEATADVEPDSSGTGYDLSPSAEDRPATPGYITPPSRPAEPFALDKGVAEEEPDFSQLDDQSRSDLEEDDIFSELEQQVQAEDYVEDVGDIDSEDKAALTQTILRAFLEACEPLSSRLNKWLAHSEISDEVIEQLQLVTLPRNYMRVSQALVEEYGQRAVLDAGLLVLRRGPRPNQPVALPAFRSFFSSGVEMLVVPYLRQAQPVFFNALPMARPEKLKKLNLRPRRTTNANEPALLNEDTLDVVDRVLICRGEFLTMIALSHGYKAVGISGWSRFDPSWAHWFTDKEVLLVGPQNPSAEVSIGSVRFSFQNAGLPEPNMLLFEPGTPLVDFLDTHVPQGWSEGLF